MIRSEILAKMEGYAFRHEATGGFLRAVAENDLQGAVFGADEGNLAALEEIVRWFYYEAPAMCHGSKEAVEQWLAREGRQ